ncbi:MAG: Uma2 family endonuclease [Synechococcales cyanobacterium RM1_1_8]|nr:Uma2 family endonuclease [Synechococcales cyanobacterium RM1_1_8]
MTVTLATWTVEEYHELVATGVLRDRAVELLNGQIVEMPPEGPEHRYLGEEAATYLRRKLGSRARVSEARPITLPEQGSEPEPDISVVRQLGEVYYERHPSSEDVFLVIEFSKLSLAKDLETKRNTYAAAGLKDYWVSNLKARELVVHRDPVNGDYRSVEVLRSGTLSLLAFPDVEISVSSLFKR